MNERDKDDAPSIGERDSHAIGKVADADRPTCLRCGVEVMPKPWGCKNPCPNCGFAYPLGDCSD